MKIFRRHLHLASFIGATSAASAYPFATPREIAAVTPAAGWMATADFNHDGRVDVVVPVANNQLKLFTANADLTFTAHAPFGGWNGVPVHAIAADTERDSHPDLVIAVDPAGGEGRIVVMQNNGTGIFTMTAERQLGFQLQATSRLTATDLDFDKHIDIVAGFEDGALAPGADVIAFLPGDGDGGFEAPVLQSVLYPLPCGSCARDFNRDGNMDFVMSAASPPKLLYFRGKPDGTFQTPVPLTQPEDNVKEVHAADFDRDGRTDLLVRADSSATNTNHSVTWRQNIGGSFATPVALFSSQSARVNGIAAADFDKDGDIDAAFTTTPQSGGIVFPAVTMSVNDGNGSFANDVLGLVSDPKALTAADVDHDGDSDLLVLGGSSLMLLENVTLHRSIVFSSVPALTAPASVSGLVTADFDGDGDEDVMAGNSGAASFLSFFRNTGGSLTPAQSINIGAQGVIALAAGDFDRDGDADITVAKPSSIVDTSELILLLNDGAAHFTAQSPAEVEGDIGQMIAADWAHDGSPSVFFASGQEAWSLNPLTMARSRIADSPGVITGLWAADLVPGGYDEIMYQAISGFGSQSYYYRFTSQQGNVTHLLGAQDAGTPNPFANHGVTAADLDRDGDSDPVVARVPDSLMFHRNNGGGNFTGLTNQTQRKVKHMAPEDFDTDGASEILYLEPENKAVRWRGLEKVGGFAFVGNRKPEHALITDVNRDGKPDLVVLDTGMDQLFTFPNNGGEYTAEVTAVTDSGKLGQGDEGSLFTLEARHHGKRGEPDIHMGSFRLDFGVEQPGGVVVPMGDAQAIQVLEKIILRRRDVNGAIPGSGILLAEFPIGQSGLDAGSYAATMAPADALLSHGQERWFDFDIKLKPAALQSGISKLVVSFVLENGLPPAFKVAGVPGAVIHNDAATLPSNPLKVITLFNPKPIQVWRKQHFNTYDDAGIAANIEDADDDRVPNIVEYVQATIPTSAASARPLDVVINAVGRPELGFSLAEPAPVDARVDVQFSPNMKTGTWQQVATRNGNGPWTGLFFPNATGSAANGLKPWGVADPAGQFHFFRLRAAELP